MHSVYGESKPQAKAGTLEPPCELARAGVRSAKARVMKQGADRGQGVLGCRGKEEGLREVTASTC